MAQHLAIFDKFGFKHILVIIFGLSWCLQTSYSWSYWKC